MRRLAAALGMPLDETIVGEAAGLNATSGSGGLTAGDRGSGNDLSLQVLGPLAAYRDRVPLPLGGGKRRAVLGLLAVHPGAVVSLDAISEVLWGGELPLTAAAMIQSHVSRLRGLLEPVRVSAAGGGLLQTTDVGYRLQTGGVDLDLVSFRQLAEGARAARRAADSAAACELFERALALWRGEPLADVALLRGHPAVVGLTERWAEVVVEYAETASAAGWHDQVLPHLQALARREPLNERAHACLMIALAGSGQQAAALEVYAEARRRLDDQLGVRPGAGLAAAHERVLRHDIPAVTAIPGPSDSPGVVPGWDHREGSQASRPFQLPPAVADFTGRSEQLVQLQRLVGPDDDRAGVPVVVISGPPGAGKTALMVHAGHIMRPFFPDGQLWAQLDGASDRPRDPGDVLGEMLRALGLPGSAIPSAASERAALFRSRLADRRVLIAADDAASAAQIRPLLPGTVGCAVMVTSRRQLAELPGAKLLPLGALALAEATDLLGRIAGPERVTAERRAAGDLASGCGQMPLAVRIAGAKLAARPSAPIAILARAVADERNRLDALQIGDLSVRASLTSGYQSLSEAARRAFRLLGLLGPCDVAEWAVAALLGEPDAGQIVNELYDRSMLTLAGTDHTGQARFRLHDLLRDYASEELAGEPEPQRRAALERVDTGWLQLASIASAALPRDPYFPFVGHGRSPEVIPAARARRLTAEPVAWFDAERLNLLGAVDRACAAGDYQFATKLVLCQAEFQHLQERQNDADRMWRAIENAAVLAGDAAAVADARLRLGAVAVERGYAAEALDLLEECVATFEQRGDPRNLAYALYWRGASAWDLEFYSDARRDAERGVALGRQVADPYAEFNNLRLLGLALGRLGQPAQAIAACERALAVAVGLGGKSCEAVALHNLAFTCTMAGQWERALGLVMRQLELCRKLGEVRNAALALGVRGDAYHGLGRYEDEVAALLEALPTFRSHSIRRLQALCLSKIGYAYQAMGHHQLAAQYLEESLPIFRRLGLPSYEQRVMQALQDCRSLNPAPPG
jgi:DNA-binding SARP family transcriptional activator/tetratricopeptide (TPR) repeat protein